jgi:hypothetical protein
LEESREVSLVVYQGSTLEDMSIYHGSNSDRREGTRRNEDSEGINSIETSKVVKQANVTIRPAFRNIILVAV